MTTENQPEKLATANELLLDTQKEHDDMQHEKVYYTPLHQIDSFPEHPFLVRDDEEMHSMVESIKQYGVLSPAIARNKEDGRFECKSQGLLSPIW